MSKTLEKIERVAARHERKLKHGYYLENPNREDMGMEFCPKCVQAVIKQEREKGKTWEKYQLDPSADHDGRCHCHSCGAHLHGRYTEYAAESELEHFEEHGFDINDPSDCHSWVLCEGVWLSGSEEHVRLLAVAGLTQEATQ